MKKILFAMALFGLAYCAMPVSACSSDSASVTTGAACSIKELNLEKDRLERKRPFVEDLNKEKDLRPVSTESSARVLPNDGCIFGHCLYKSLFK